MSECPFCHSALGGGCTCPTAQSAREALAYREERATAITMFAALAMLCVLSLCLVIGGALSVASRYGP